MSRNNLSITHLNLKPELYGKHVYIIVLTEALLKENVSFSFFHWTFFCFVLEARQRTLIYCKCGYVWEQGNMINAKTSCFDDIFSGKDQ